MEFTLKLNKTDSSMIEAYYEWNKKQYLAFVVHEDVFDGTDLEFDENEECIVEIKTI